MQFRQRAGMSVCKMDRRDPPFRLLDQRLGILLAELYSVILLEELLDLLRTKREFLETQAANQISRDH